MRKLLIIVTCCFTFHSYGQRNLVNIGIEGGCSRATLRGNRIIDEFHNARIGYSGGIFAQYNIKSFFSIRVGGYYEVKGSSIKFQATEQNGDPTVGNGPNALVFNTLTVRLLASAPVDPPGGTSRLGSATLFSE